MESAGTTTQPEGSLLTPGLHAVHVEMATDRSFRIRSLEGERLQARLADGVDRDLIEQCMRTNQLVIVTPSRGQMLILGALQTQRTFHREADGTLLLEGDRVELRAAHEVRLRTGASALKLTESGRVRINGHRMVLDVDTNVRILSAMVELP